MTPAPDPFTPALVASARRRRLEELADELAALAAEVRRESPDGLAFPPAVVAYDLSHAANLTRKAAARVGRRAETQDEPLVRPPRKG